MDSFPWNGFHPKTFLAVTVLIPLIEGLLEQSSFIENYQISLPENLSIWDSEAAYYD